MIADSQALSSDSLALALAWSSDIEVLTQRPVTASDAIKVAVSEKPDVLLLDYWMDMDGPAATRMILKRLPTCKIILLSWFHGQREIEDGLEAGAVGFLPRSVLVAEVAEAIRLAAAGVSPVYHEKLKILMNKLNQKDNVAAELWERLVTLTDREVLILRLLSLGHVSGEIAEYLVLSPTTIRKHIDNIIKKLDVHSQVEAIALGRRSGLVQI